MITRSEVDGILRDIISERPGYVYVPPEFAHTDSEETTNECAYYAPDGAPSCLIGHLFARLVDDGRLDASEFGAARFLANSDRGALAPGELVIDNFERIDELPGREQFTDDAVALMSDVQQRQDLHNAWGDLLPAGVTR